MLKEILFQYWCPTELDDNNNYQSTKWGYCSIACLLELPKCKTTSGPVVSMKRIIEFFLFL